MDVRKQSDEVVFRAADKEPATVRLKVKRVVGRGLAGVFSEWVGGCVRGICGPRRQTVRDIGSWGGGGGWGRDV